MLPRWQRAKTRDRAHGKPKRRHKVSGSINYVQIPANFIPETAVTPAKMGHLTSQGAALLASNKSSNAQPSFIMFGGIKSVRPPTSVKGPG